jgi:hypothetical protein
MRRASQTARPPHARAVRRAVRLLLLPLAIAACVNQPREQRVLRAAYSTPLVEVALPAGAGGETTRVATSELTIGDSLRYVFADSVVEIRTAMLADRVALSITNRTDGELTVDWDAARYADYDGGVGKVMRAAGKRRRGGQRPSVIPAKRTLTEAVLPDSRVVHVDGRDGPFGWKRGGWGHAPLMTVWSTTVFGAPDTPDAVRQREAFLADVQAMMGKRIGVMIPLRSGSGVASAYTLWFTVQGAAVVEE